MAKSVAILRRESAWSAIEWKWTVRRWPPPPGFISCSTSRAESVTTASDEKGRQTVYAFLDSALPWVAPVGRLDKASEGLLLLTNDSEWAAQVQAPASHLNKTYHVQIDRVADAALLESISTGSQNGRGRVPAGLERSHPARRQTQYLARNSFGRGQEPSYPANAGMRLAWRCCAWCGLRSVHFPSGELPKGNVRALTGEEKQAIDKALHDHIHAGARPARPKSHRQSR